jgi:hypothetical protein
MLISSGRQISDYSSAAGDVRLQIATTRALGQPTAPVTAIERQGIQTIEELVNLGKRFGHDVSGNLNFTGSTPEEIDLVGELEKFLPGQLPDVQDTQQNLDVRKWSEFAAEIFNRLREEAPWTDFSSAQQRFIDVELEPFLVKLLNAPPEDKEE